MTREFPSQPVIGVGAVVVQNGRAVIVRRAHAPGQGEWSIPGGRVRAGESLVDALGREIKEETGLDIIVGPLIDVVERIERDQDRVRYHFVVLDYLCACRGGALCAGDDAADARWVAADELPQLELPAPALAIIRKGLAMAVASSGLRYS